MRPTRFNAVIGSTLVARRGGRVAGQNGDHLAEPRDAAEAQPLPPKSLYTHAARAVGPGHWSR